MNLSVDSSQCTHLAGLVLFVFSLIVVTSATGFPSAGFSGRDKLSSLGSNSSSCSGFGIVGIDGGSEEEESDERSELHGRM